MVLAPIKMSGVPQQTDGYNVKRQRFAKLVRQVVDRLYESKIDRYLDLKILPTGIIRCAFVDDGKVVEMEILPSGQAEFYQAEKSDRRRTDSAIEEGYLASFMNTQHRFDAVAQRKPRKCTKGIPCKGTCITKGFTCRKPVTDVVPAGVFLEMRRLTDELKPAMGGASADELDNKSIRELKSLAQKENIYRYSYMTSDELKTAIRTAKQSPEQQGRIGKTIDRRKAERAAIESFAPKGAVDAWRKIDKITKAFGTNPGRAGLLIAAVLIGASNSTITSMREKYKKGLDESAQMALDRARKMPIDNTSKPNILFAVGGFSGAGSSGKKLKDLLEENQEDTKADGWFGKKNHIVDVSSKEFDINTPSASKFNPDGSYNFGYLGSVAQQSFGKFVQNFQRGRNEAAVDLAAQMYAYGAQYPKKAINVMGHGVGGNVVREATEIMSRMRPTGGVSGQDVIKRMNIANLGTPYFGFTDDSMWSRIKHRTITSSQDPFSVLPKTAAQWISSVKGHEPESYLRNLDVRDRLREAFGYYGSSIAGRKQSEEKFKQTYSAIGEALELVPVPGLASTWNGIGKIADKYKNNKAAAAIATGVLLTGTGAGVYLHRRKKYEESLSNFASEAERQANEMIDDPNFQRKMRRQRNSTTFVVGGAGMTSEELEKQLRENASPEDKKWMSRSQVVAFQNDIDPGIPEGVSIASPEGIGYLARKLYGGTLQRLLKTGPDPKAVELAKQMYAHGQSFQLDFDANGNPTAARIPNNVVAVGEGGQIVREAMDILARMGGADSKRAIGKKIANQTQVVTVGTPYFGFTNNAKDIKEVVRETQVIGDGDMLGRTSFLQKPRTVQSTGVGGASASDYMGSSETTKQIFREIRNTEQWHKPQPLERGEAPNEVVSEMIGNVKSFRTKKAKEQIEREKQAETVSPSIAAAAKLPAGLSKASATNSSAPSRQPGFEQLDPLEQFKQNAEFVRKNTGKGGSFEFTPKESLETLKALARNYAKFTGKDAIDLLELIGGLELPSLPDAAPKKPANKPAGKPRNTSTAVPKGNGTVTKVRTNPKSIRP